LTNKETINKNRLAEKNPNSFPNSAKVTKVGDINSLYDGKDLWKKYVLSLKRKTAETMHGESSENKNRFELQIYGQMNVASVQRAENQPSAALRREAR